MRSDSILVRAASLWSIGLVVVGSIFFANARSPVTSDQSQNKLPVRLKAKLPDYKGPSRFMGRKALITFSPDGRLVAMSGTHRTITIWDAETGARKATLVSEKEGKDGISGFAFNPDGRTAATRDYLDKSVRLWDINTKQVKATLPGRKRNLETKLKTGMTFEDEM